MVAWHSVTSLAEALSCIRICLAIVSSRATLFKFDLDFGLIFALKSLIIHTLCKSTCLIFFARSELFVKSYCRFVNCFYSWTLTFWAVILCTYILLATSWSTDSFIVTTWQRHVRISTAVLSHLLCGATQLQTCAFFL